eukprot:1780869-Pyramimonas_sp.AAC.1
MTVMCWVRAAHPDHPATILSVTCAGQPLKLQAGAHGARSVRPSLQQGPDRGGPEGVHRRGSRGDLVAIIEGI